MLSTADFTPDESGGFQHADMTRYTGECHRQWSGQIGDARVTLTQRLQQVASGRIGERSIRLIQHLMFNHSVDYSRSP